jgi:hypothetical protein
MTNYYRAKEGMTFVRKADGFNMGEELWLGKSDSIDNYEEVSISIGEEL